MRYIDLHTHTMASDGALTPAQLVHHALNEHVGVLAITDHDAVYGVDEAIAEGEKCGVSIIPGVELSATHGREMHILGLYIDTKQADLASTLENLRGERAARNYKMLELFNAQGFKLSDEDVLKYKPGYGMDTIGRVHFARALVEKAYCGDFQTALRDYVADASRVYVQRKHISAQKAIELIHKAGGYAFLAHGFRTFAEAEAEQLFATLDTLREFGLDGAECYHGRQTVHQTELLLRYCEQHELLVSGGSDFHGEYKPDVQLATMSYGLKLPVALMQRLNKEIKDKKSNLNEPNPVK